MIDNFAKKSPLKLTALSMTVQKKQTQCASFPGANIKEALLLGSVFFNFASDNDKNLKSKNDPSKNNPSEIHNPSKLHNPAENKNKIEWE